MTAVATEKPQARAKSRAKPLVKAHKPVVARLEARVSADLHVTVKRAAELQGRTLTDFVVHALQQAATQAIEQAELVRLVVTDQTIFAQALIDPPKANATLKRAFAKSSKLLAV